MSKENWKQIFMSILVGACVAFITKFVDGFADFLKNHSTEVITGSATAFYHITRTFRS